MTNIRSIGMNPRRCLRRGRLKPGIQPQNVRHLLFTFSGNNPEAHLTGALQTYAGGIAQWSVGLRIEGHAAFVAAVYDLVIANAHH